MNSILTHDERKEQEQSNEQVLLTDQHWDSEDDDDENDSDYTPDRDTNDLDAESVTSEDERQVVEAEEDDDDDECDSSSSSSVSGNSPETPVDTPASFLSKRKSNSLENNDHVTKRTKINEQEQERRRARVDAIWAEMNQKDQDKKKPVEKQPLDDISSSVNRTSSRTIPEAKSPSSTTVSTDGGTTTTTTGTTTTTTTTTTTGAAAAAAPATKAAPRKKIVRPKSMLSALVSQYNIKVPKMNTLEKSRLDWQGYVDREGIRDDLKYKNKDGYMEKVAFLQRVDDRRLSHLKAGQKATKK